MTKHMANRIEPPRLRKLFGCAQTSIDKIPAQATITTAPPNRGRTKNTASTQTSEKYGWATILFSVIVVCIILVVSSALPVAPNLLFYAGHVLREPAGEVPPGYLPPGLLSSTFREMAQKS